MNELNFNHPPPPPPVQSSNHSPRFEWDGRCTECGNSETPLWRQGPMGHKTLCNACGIRWRKNYLAGEAKKSNPKKLEDSPDQQSMLSDHTVIPTFSLSPGQPFPAVLPQATKSERKKKSKKKNETELLKTDSPSEFDETKRNRKRKIEYSPSYSPSKKKKSDGAETNYPKWSESPSPSPSIPAPPVTNSNIIDDSTIDIPPNYVVEDDYNKPVSDDEDGFISLPSTPLAPPLLPKHKPPQAKESISTPPLAKKKSTSSNTPVNINNNISSPPNEAYTKVSSSPLLSSTKKPSTNKILRGIVVSLDSLVQQQRQTECKIQNLLFQYPQLQLKSDSANEEPVHNVSSSQLVGYQNFQPSLKNNIQTLFNVLFIQPNQHE